jgi:hypothetical protein
MTTINDSTLDALEHILRDNHVGESNAATSDTLATALGERDTHDTNPSIRDAVRQLVLERHVPVASSNRGYWIVRDSDGVDAEIESIRDRIGALNERMLALKSARGEFDFAECAPDPDEGDCDECGGLIQGDAWLYESQELCRDCYPGVSGFQGDAGDLPEEVPR